MNFTNRNCVTERILNLMGKLYSHVLKVDNMQVYEQMSFVVEDQIIPIRLQISKEIDK
jgi:hypothetical protein